MPSPWLTRAILVLAVLAAHLPVLNWTQFHNAEEAVNVATALELRRDHHWQVPTLNAVPRLVKPPLTAWTTAAFLRPATIARLDTDPDPAYRALTFEARLPAAILIAILVVATFDLGAAAGGPLLGLLAAAICASNFLVCRFAQLNETDTQLAAWATLASSLLATAHLKKRPLLYLPAGLALGLASMSKGPALPLLQNLLPFAIFLGWCRNPKHIAACRGQAEGVPARGAPAGIPAPRTCMLLGAAIFLAVGLWWYVWVIATAPDLRALADLWLREITRYRANDLAPQPWYKYFVSLPFLLPWSPLAAVGLFVAARQLRRRTGDPVVLPLLLFAVPFVVMCFFRERKDRYLLPLVAPLAVLTARAALDLLPDKRRLATAAVLAIAVAFLAFNAAYTWHQGRSKNGQAPLRATAMTIRTLAPENATYHAYHPSGQYEAIFSDAADLAIYLDRTITWQSDPARLPPPAAPRVWFTVEPKDAPAPAPPTPTSRPLSTEQRRGETLYFFTEDPRTARQAD